MKHNKNRCEDDTLEELIRKNLIDAITHCGLSQTEIAKRAYITDASLSDYIHKNKLPSLCTFARLCKIMDVSADEVLNTKT